MRLPWRRENSEKAPDIPWFWTLTIDGRPAANFDWPDILQGLEGLRADPTAFWPWSAKIRRASKSPAFCSVLWS